MRKNINILKVWTLWFLVVIVAIIGSLELVLFKKKNINTQILSIVEQSNSIEDVSSELESMGYENYVDGSKLMVKIKGIWNTLYYEKYLDTDNKENTQESVTMYSR